MKYKSKYALQYKVNKETYEIVNSIRRERKALFIEMAIKKLSEDKEVMKFFTNKDEV